MLIPKYIIEKNAKNLLLEIIFVKYKIVSIVIKKFNFKISKNSEFLMSNNLESITVNLSLALHIFYVMLESEIKLEMFYTNKAETE